VPRPHPALFAALVTLLLTELISAGGLVLAERRRPGSVLDLFLPAHFARLDKVNRTRFVERWHDPELGWAPRPGMSIEETNAAGARWRASWDGRGARAGPGNMGPPLAGAWGDSFTLCDDVNDGETWEVTLAQELGGAVLNWGVPGYGLDQAVLRFERALRDDDAPPIAILGVHTDDLPRALGAFRPFYVAGTDLPLGFKPVSVVHEGAVHVRPSPWTDPTLDLAALEALAWEVAPHDAYASAMARLRPPFTWHVARLLTTRLAGERTTRSWQEPEGAIVARYWLDRFVRAARAADRTPVLLLLPGPASALAPTQPYDTVIAALQADDPALLVVDAAPEVRRAGSFVAPGRGHLSREGNQRVGRLLAARLPAR
jgi:hypothetical protein